MKKTSEDTILILVIINDTPYNNSIKFLFDLYQEKSSNASITIITVAIA
ncbi:MAG TPA: hypothetical protein VFS97_07910 [Nitrososphaeraceae archaeon]|nr:hypothetical protein [Nitrososphaeraceae archaeon]